MNIDALVEMLESANVDDFTMARDIVYEQFIMKDDEKSLARLTKELSSRWNDWIRDQLEDQAQTPVLVKTLKGRVYYYYRYDLGVNVYGLKNLK